MVSGRAILTVDEISSLRWDTALDLLTAGGGTVSFGDLLAWSEVAADGRQLHIEFGAPTSASGSAADNEERLGAIVELRLSGARGQIRDMAVADPRFGDLVANSSLSFDCVDDHGMGTVLIASAGPDGALTWA